MVHKLLTIGGLLPAASLLFFLSLPAVKANPAPTSGTIFNLVTPNQAVNSQSAIGSVNQSPIGGINNNTQINNSQATDYGFAPGIFCRDTTLTIGAYGAGANSYYNTGNSGVGNYGGIIGFNIPLGGETNQLCRQLAKEIVTQRQLDTSLNIIKQCAILKKEGIEFDLKVFPEFERCNGVSLAKGANFPTDQRPRAEFSERNQPLVTVPVR